MKKLIGLICLLVCSNGLSAQSNATAKGALDAVIKSFGVFDTTTAFSLLSDKLAAGLRGRIARDVKELTPTQFARRIEVDKIHFLTIKVGKAYETDSVTVFAVTTKKEIADTDDKVWHSYVVLIKVNGLWYLDSTERTPESIEWSYPALKVIITALREPGLGKPTAMLCYDAIKTAFSTNDTTTIFNLTYGEWADKMVRKMKRKRNDKEWMDRNMNETKSMFSTMAIIKAFETDTLVAYHVGYKAPIADMLSHNYLVFKRVKDLWYFVMMDDGYFVKDRYPALRAIIGTEKPIDEENKD